MTQFRHNMSLPTVMLQSVSSILQGQTPTRQSFAFPFANHTHFEGKAVPSWLNLLAGTGDGTTAVAKAARGLGVFVSAIATGGGAGTASEVQIDYNDVLSLPLLAGLVFGCRARLTAATYASGCQLVMGFGSAKSTMANLDSQTYNCWFRAKVAASLSATVYAETDDNSTNTDLQDFGVSLAAPLLDSSAPTDGFHEFIIDASNLSQIDFYVDGVLRSTPAMGLKLSGAVAASYVQPMLGIFKGGTHDIISAEFDSLFVGATRVSSANDLV